MKLSQNDVKVRGWAINCRINAEDPRSEFNPSPGKVIYYHPAAGPGIRVDSALYSGYSVSEHYDSLIAKLAAHGRNREDSIRRMKGALSELEIIGIPTTIPLHQSIMVDSQFNAGKFSTTYLDILGPTLREALARLEEDAAALGAANRAIRKTLKNTRVHRSSWRMALQMHRQGV